MALRLQTGAWLAAVVTCLGGAQSALAQFPENFDTTAVGTLPAGWATTGSGASTPWAVVNNFALSGTNSVFTNNPATTSNRNLDLPPIVAAGPVTLEFWSRLAMENGFDGFAVYVSINAGAFTNVGQLAWRTNGYNCIPTTTSNTALVNQRCFSGTLAIYQVWTQRIASVNANVGDSVQFRIVAGTDGSVAATGVWLDDINVTTAATGACCIAGACSILTPANCAASSGTFSPAAACATAVCPGTAFAEVEANEDRPTATVINLLAPGDFITGTTTGSVATAGATSLDQFRVKTPTAPLAIYKNRLSILSTAGATDAHTGSVRGLTQTAAALGTWPCSLGTATATDSTFQLSSNSNSAPPKSNVWYGFGKQEEIYYRVTGTLVTTAPYAVVWTREQITPTSLGTFIPGLITIRTDGQGHTTDTDLWVYNSTLDPIDGYSNEDAHLNGGAPATVTTTSFLRRTYAPGTYYLAISNVNLANNRGAPCDDNARTSALLDFANAIADSSGTPQVLVSFAIADSTGTQLFPATKPTAYDVLWYSFTVNDPTGACCASDGTCSVGAASACLSPSLFQGAGSACTGPGGTCPGPVTACCNPVTLACVFTNGATCPAGMQAFGAVCSPVPCPAAAGRCCIALVCSVTYSPADGGCAGGTWLSGATCATAPCTYCTAGSSACTIDERISRVQFNTIDNSSPAVPPGCYTDFTGVSTSLFQAQSYPIIVTNANPFAGTQCRVWCDWNMNNIFEVGSNEEFPLTTTDNIIFTGTVTVPATANLGATRLRIRLMFTGTFSPCGSVSFGEVEDYTVTVVAPTIGACCFETGACSVGLSTACPLPNLYQGAGSTCSGTGGSCPATVSACCHNTTGACVYIVGTTCAAGSTNLGAGSTCSPNNCPTTGACCASDGTCSLTNAAGCAVPNVFVGLGSTCSGTGGTCPATATSACCNLITNACAFIAGATCPAGTARAGALCSPLPCTGTGACCDTTAGTCTQVADAASCATPLLFHGIGSTCAPAGACPARIARAFDALVVGTLPECWTANNAPPPGGAAWAVTSLRSNSPSNSVGVTYVAADISLSKFVTLSAVRAAGPLALDFWRFYILEGTTICFDSFTVEVSINAGAFTNLRPTPTSINPWITGGYNGAASATSNPVNGQPAFCFAAPGASWNRSTAVVSAAADDQVVFRFRLSTDSSVAPTGAGIWIDDLTISNLKPQGVCCDSSSACTLIFDCICPPGSVFNAATSCTPSPCVVSACCTGSTCSVVSNQACINGGGTIQAGSSCTPDPCAPPTGACCVAGACSQQLLANCTGFFAGVGAPCTPNVCPVCCRGSTCSTTVYSAAACTGSVTGTAGATFVVGATAACGGANHLQPCCYADYNKIGGRNVSDIFAYLTDWFAARPWAIVGGDGTGVPNVSHIFAFLTDWFAGGCP